MDIYDYWETANEHLLDTTPYEKRTIIDMTSLFAGECWFGVEGEMNKFVVDMPTGCVSGMQDALFGRAQSHKPVCEHQVALLNARMQKFNLGITIQKPSEGHVVWKFPT